MRASFLFLAHRGRYNIGCLFKVLNSNLATFVWKQLISQLLNRFEHFVQGTAVQNDSLLTMNVTHERDFAGFEFKMAFGGVLSYIARGIPGFPRRVLIDTSAGFCFPPQRSFDHVGWTQEIQGISPPIQQPYTFAHAYIYSLTPKHSSSPTS